LYLRQVYNVTAKSILQMNECNFSDTSVFGPFDSKYFFANMTFATTGFCTDDYLSFMTVSTLSVEYSSFNVGNLSLRKKHKIYHLVDCLTIRTKSFFNTTYAFCNVYNCVCVKYVWQFLFTLWQFHCFDISQSYIQIHYYNVCVYIYIYIYIFKILFLIRDTREFDDSR